MMMSVLETKKIDLYVSVYVMCFSNEISRARTNIIYRTRYSFIFEDIRLWYFI